VTKHRVLTGETFKVWSGWLEGFKTRFGIKSFGLHGESGDAPAASVGMAKGAVPKIIESGGYQPADVYNCDESGLYYRAKPNKTLATGPVRGKKREKDRITVLLCTNITGTDRRKPLIIHKSKKPRCFGNWNPNVHCDYHSNPSAWMNGAIFSDWVQKMNRSMALQKRNLIMFCNNAGSHDIPNSTRAMLHGLETIKLSNLTLAFLPANTTSVIQPLDQGIIAAWKMGYKRKLLEWTIAEYDDAAEGTDLGKVQANVKQAITWAVEAWNELSNCTIRNCWVKSGLLPLLWSVQFNNADENVHMRRGLKNDMEALTRLIDKMDLGVLAMNTAEYINIPAEKQIEVDVTDEMLVGIAQGLEAEALQVEIDNDSAGVEIDDDDDDGIDVNDIEPVIVECS
jgi:hypothetical protein